MLSQLSWTLWTSNCHHLAFKLSCPDRKVNLFRLCPELVVRTDWLQLRVIPESFPRRLPLSPLTRGGTKGSDSGITGWKSKQTLWRSSWVISKEGCGYHSSPGSDQDHFSHPFYRQSCICSLRSGCHWLETSRVTLGVLLLLLTTAHLPKKHAFYHINMMLLGTGNGGYTGKMKGREDDISQSAQSKTAQFCHCNPWCDTRGVSGRDGLPL